MMPFVVVEKRNALNEWIVLEKENSSEGDLYLVANIRSGEMKWIINSLIVDYKFKGLASVGLKK